MHLLYTGHLLILLITASGQMSFNSWCMAAHCQFTHTRVQKSVQGGEHGLFTTQHVSDMMLHLWAA